MKTVVAVGILVIVVNVVSIVVNLSAGNYFWVAISGIGLCLMLWLLADIVSDYRTCRLLEKDK